MIRRPDNPFAWRAGLMSLLVHGILIGLMLMSFHWKTNQPMSIAQVELWDNMPVAKPEPVAKLPEPKPVEPPKPVVEEKPVPTPEPEPAPVAEIQIKKEPIKHPPKEKKLVEKPKELTKPEPKVDNKKIDEEKLKKLQQALLAEDTKVTAAPAKKQEGTPNAKDAQMNAGELDKYKTAIRNKVKQNVNNQPCGTDDVEVTYKIAVIPTGEVTSVSLVKSSGIQACDDAVERAIHSSSPLPIPTDAALMNQFRNLTMPFRPNGKS